MADSNLTLDPNGRNVLGSISDSDGSISPAYHDHTTKRIKVDASISDVSITDIEDGDGDSIMDAVNNAMQVSIVNDGVGIGGGTEYTEAGTPPAHPVGKVIVFDNGASAWQDVDSAHGLPVQLLTGSAAIGKLAANSGVDIGDVDVLSLPDVDINDISKGTQTNDVKITLDSEEVTVNLGSTDNGVLDAIAASLAIIDDWDSSDTAKVTLQTGSAAIGKLAANSGVDIGDVDITSIAAGDNNIGNMDIVSLPSGNLGMQAMVASLSVVPASNITDATYIGDIKFGESLPAGTNAIGKLAANSGVDIGDVDVTSLPALAAGTNAVGKLLPPDIDVTTNSNYAKKYYTNAGAVTDGIIWSPAAGKRWHIHTIYINVSAAATVTLEDDKAGGDEAIWKGELAANSGVVLTFPEKYPWASGEDAADLLITTSAGNVYVSVSGFEI